MDRCMGKDSHTGKPKKKGWCLPNVCPLCLQVEEINDHLPLHCDLMPQAGDFFKATFENFGTSLDTHSFFVVGTIWVLIA